MEGTRWPLQSDARRLEAADYHGPQFGPPVEGNLVSRGNARQPHGTSERYGTPSTKRVTK